MTRLERAITPLCEDHPGECGILALDDSVWMRLLLAIG